MKPVAVGDRFMFHDARGVRGPYVVEQVTPGGGGLSAVCRLQRGETTQAAWASEKWLREGVVNDVGWVVS